MPTIQDVAVLTTTATSDDVLPGIGGATDLITNEEEADAFVAKFHAQPFPIFSPPGSRPICMGGVSRVATTKAMHKAEKRAAKEKKAKNVKERKAVVAACKLATQAKKRAKLILRTDARIQKTAAKVAVIRAKLTGVMAQGAATSSTKPPGSHVPKKSKGASGQVTLPSSFPTSSTHSSPQQKGASPKKRTMINSPLRLLMGLSSSSSSYSTMDSVEYSGNVPAAGRADTGGISWVLPLLPLAMVFGPSQRVVAVTELRLAVGCGRSTTAPTTNA
jgi:hypothetical protein